MISFKIIPHSSAEYFRAVALREEILRKPLGLSFSSHELEQEKEHVHLIGYLNDEICATAVLVPEGRAMKMQRVAVRSDLQSKGIGSALLSFCEEYARKNGVHSLYCHARHTAVSFYLRNGYILEGAPFDEDGIPHQKMYKNY